MKINFDDITSEVSPYQNIPENYQGLIWDADMYVISASTLDYVGRNVMITSGQYAIFLDDFKVEKTIRSSENFNFMSAAMTSYGASAGQYVIKGFADGVEKYTMTAAVNSDAPRLIDFNFMDIDRLTFTRESGAWLTMDDLVIEAVTTVIPETPGVTITGDDFVTSEQGDSAKFSVRLNTAPTREVVITFTSSDSTEGIITNNKLTFTSSDWSTPKEFTVTGQNDTLDDKDINYQIIAKVDTRDVNYYRLAMNPLTMTNQDDGEDGQLILSGDKNGIPVNDILQGLDGNDRLYGLLLPDDLSGGGGNDSLYGGYDDDFLYGETGNDQLFGEQDNDELDGGAGDDTLDGGLGSDIMSGGAGNDTYFLGYDAKDVIIDKGLSTDVDTIIMPYVMNAYTLPKGIENGTISEGTQNSNLTGNVGNNTLSGNDGVNILAGMVGRDSLFGGGGNDILLGGIGSDTLNGGSGKDVFKFINNDVADKIDDFKPVDDTLQLENSVFTKLGGNGVMNKEMFKMGTVAADNNDYIIYNANNGKILYDADGNGAGAAVEIATIGTNLTLTNMDFVII